MCNYVNTWDGFFGLGAWGWNGVHVRGLPSRFTSPPFGALCVFDGLLPRVWCGRRVGEVDGVKSGYGHGGLVLDGGVVIMRCRELK